MKVGKPKSKRVPVRLRHKIEKASAAKQKKARKEAKKNPQWRSRLKKDPGIPNLFPYKDKILSEIEESRRKKEEEAQRRRDMGKAQRNGFAVTDVNQTIDPGAVNEIEDEKLVDGPQSLDSDEEMDGNGTDPMAALIASAQARAQAYSRQAVEEDDDHDEGDDDNDNEDDNEWNGIVDAGSKRAQQLTHKVLPKQALADPIKTVSVLLDRLQRTQEGMQQLLDHYQIPPLVTANSDTTSRFLVEVARKRGRLGRGGIPNLHSAALTVLSDINEERMKLPALDFKPKASSTTSKGDVQIVRKMAEPFRIEGLFNDEPPTEIAMDIES